MKYFGAAIDPLRWLIIYNPGSDRCRRCGYPACFCLARGLPPETPRCFHVASTPACVGTLPNVFLKTPGVHRLLHPFYSVAAVGPGAAERQRAG